MTDEKDKIGEKQTRYDLDFQELYEYLTSESVKLASDKLFSATPEELAEAYKPDDYSNCKKPFQFLNQPLKFSITHIRHCMSVRV